MKSITTSIAGIVLLLAAAATGYWFGTHASSATKAAAPAVTERKVLYYRNPMGLPDISPVPKKDSMGMDYVPVYADEAQGAPKSNTVNIDIDKVQKLGVKSEAVTRRELHRSLRLTGRIEVDERRIYTIAPKFEGWVERLYANATGQHVAKGQPLFDVYSPDLVSAQREHELAVQGLASLKDADAEARESMRRLAAASEARLRNWDIAGAQTVTSGGRPLVSFRAPFDGVVLEKKAVQGMRFMPGEMLYQVADLSSVWVIAEASEQDIGEIRAGSLAEIAVEAYPNRTFSGKVSFIYPTLDAATRTVKVRMEMPNPKGLLKPAMFASARIETASRNKVLASPASAVIDSGTRQLVLVRLAEGRFEPRSVTLGSRGDDYVEVVNGVSEGEQVVSSANFLIDAESNLKAALGAFDLQAASGAMSASAGASLLATDARQQAGSYKGSGVAHQAQGTLDAINPDGTVSITHGPIQSLGWPGMTMDFALANSSLVAGLKPGTPVTFEIVERAPGEWVITRLQPQHEGH